MPSILSKALKCLIRHMGQYTISKDEAIESRMVLLALLRFCPLIFIFIFSVLHPGRWGCDGIFAISWNVRFRQNTAAALTSPQNGVQPHEKPLKILSSVYFFWALRRRRMIYWGCIFHKFEYDANSIFQFGWKWLFNWSLGLRVWVSHEMRWMMFEAIFGVVFRWWRGGSG